MAAAQSGLAEPSVGRCDVLMPAKPADGSAHSALSVAHVGCLPQNDVESACHVLTCCVTKARYSAPFRTSRRRAGLCVDTEPSYSKVGPFEALPFLVSIRTTPFDARLP